MSAVKFVLDGSSEAWMNIFKNSPEIREGLMKYATAAAAKNTVLLQASDAKGVQPDHKFVAVVDVADKTMLGKVVATNGAKRAAIEAGLPKW